MLRISSSRTPNTSTGGETLGFSPQLAKAEAFSSPC